MSKTVSVSQAREQLSSFIRWAKDNSDDIIIQNRGRSEAVIIAYDDYDLLLAARMKKLRQDAISRLEELAEVVRQRNEDLSEEQADAIADEILGDAVRRLADKGKIRLQS